MANTNEPFENEEANELWQKHQRRKAHIRNVAIVTLAILAAIAGWQHYASNV